MALITLPTPHSVGQRGPQLLPLNYLSPFIRESRGRSRRYLAVFAMRPSFGARRQARKVGQDEHDPGEVEPVSENEDIGTIHTPHLLKQVLTCALEQIG